MSAIGYHSPTNSMCFDSCPPPEVSRELKACENCPIWFSRVMGSRDKYCKDCLAAFAAPVEERELCVVERHVYAQEHSGSVGRPSLRKDRIDAVSALFVQNEWVTAKQIAEVMGWKGHNPSNCVSYCRGLGLMIRANGWTDIHSDGRRIRRGHAKYVLDGVKYVAQARDTGISSDDSRWMSEQQVVRIITRNLG